MIFNLCGVIVARMFFLNRLECVGGIIVKICELDYSKLESLTFIPP